MAIYTENWGLKMPEVTEGDTAEDVSLNLDDIDEALLTPAEKNELIGGQETSIHYHPRGTPSTVLKQDNNEGDSLLYSRANHRHDVSVGTPSSVLVQANHEGSHATLARADHKHAVSVGVPSGVLVQAASEGTATSLARADHKHNIATGTPETISRESSHQGSSTSLARADHKHGVLTATPSLLVVGGSNSLGSSTSLARADHLHALPQFGNVSGTFSEGGRQRGGLTSIYGCAPGTITFFDVLFLYTFPAVPHVTASMDISVNVLNSAMRFGIDSITTTGFRVAFRHDDITTRNVRLRWTAIVNA